MQRCVAPKRHPGCHDHCPEFLEYKEKYYAEKDRMYEENMLKKAIDRLNFESAHKHEKNKGALKHGYKPKRR